MPPQSHFTAHTTRGNKRGRRLEDLSEELVQAEDLRQEDTSADEDAWYQTQEASQVLRRNLAQIHRNNAERDTCSVRSREEVMLYSYITM